MTDPRLAPPERMRSPARRCVVTTTLLVLGLSACVPPTHSPAGVATPGSWDAQLQALQQIEHYRVVGRVASRELELRADYQLDRRSARDYSLRLNGPLGIGAVELLAQDSGVSIRNRDGESHTADPEAWILQRYGWYLPVDCLGDWLLGRPRADRPSQLVMNADQQLASLRQDGWQVDFLAYQQVGSLQLPQRLQASNGVVRLTILADQWPAVEGHRP